MEGGSRINSLLTLEYMQMESENKYFDRKSGQIRVAELAPDISAFANADGGTLVIGISDKKRTLEGINSCGREKINEFINAPKECCRPMPRYREEYVDIINEEGKPDRLLLLHIEPSNGQVIRTSNDRTYLRIGDKSKEMLGENLRNLEYAKGSRHFEDEISQYAQMEDLDEELLESYKKRIGAEELDTHQVLSARGFLHNKDGKEYLTNAAVLLFAKNIMQFYPNCRVRFLRIDGRQLQVGDKMNVVKDKSIDLPILRIIDEAKSFVADQLRVFTAQDIKTGKFIEVPEYPEFPWLEGIVNAVAHRDYAMTGAYIKVSMYDDRLEIESPGCLPDVVTVHNIRETRFSRNPKISRVLTEFGWVRELNEGVKKIFSDMEESKLESPEYSDSANSVRLVLKNNIDIRTAHRNKASDKASKGEALNEALNGEESLEALRKEYGGLWEQLDDTERQILVLLKGDNLVSKAYIAEVTGKAGRTIARKLNHLLQMDVVKLNGNKYDKNHTYSINKR
jgi:ATP-dependent DNA helicase RecG